MVRVVLMGATYCKGYRVSEAAPRLGIDEKRVRALIASGELPAVRIGRAIRIPPLALEHFMTKRHIDGSEATR
jgi:excisionase family DNA binding protein